MAKNGSEQLKRAFTLVGTVAGATLAMIGLFKALPWAYKEDVDQIKNELILLKQDIACVVRKMDNRRILCRKGE